MEAYRNVLVYEVARVTGGPRSSPMSVRIPLRISVVLVSAGGVTVDTVVMVTVEGHTDGCITVEELFVLFGRLETLETLPGLL